MTLPAVVNKVDNPFLPMGTITRVRCIKTVPGANIYKGNTGWLCPHNELGVVIFDHRSNRPGMGLFAHCSYFEKMKTPA